MKPNKHLCCFVVKLLVFSILSVPISNQIVLAELITPQRLAEVQREQTQFDRLQEFVLREDVQRLLHHYGVSTVEAQARIAAMSPSELSEFSRLADQTLVGGDGGVGTVIGAVVFIFVLLLVTDIIGFTKVFPFTRSLR